MGRHDGEVGLKMAEIYFNELCLNGKKWNYSLLKKFAETKQALKEIDFAVCRISGNNYQELFEKAKSISGYTRTHQNLLYSFFKSPYETDNLKEHVIEDFVQNQYSFNGIDTPAGLSWAAVTDGVAFSFLTDSTWDTSFVSLNSINGNVFVKHASKRAHLNAWKNLIGPVQLVETSLNPSEKKFHVRQDHGNDILEDFWNRLKKSPYVEECVNSLEWQPHCRKFATVKSDNSIDFVLLWTDRGLGINVKTTGRTLRETEMIAQILEKEYGNS